jgi:hypothetical protein
MSNSRDQKFQVQIEVQDDCLLLVLPSLCDEVVVAWQEAWVLGETIERAAEDIPNKGFVLQPAQAEFDAAQMRLNTYKDKYVVLIFDHTDRIKLSYEAARICARSIRMKAQDLDFLSRGTRIVYNAPGRKGRPTPFWEETRKVFGLGVAE